MTSWQRGQPKSSSIYLATGPDAGVDIAEGSRADLQRDHELLIALSDKPAGTDFDHC